MSYAHAPALVGLALAAAGLAGCAGFTRAGVGTPANPEQLLSEARGPDENRKLHTDLIRQMIDEDRLYAALAHLKAQEQRFGDTLELTLLRAEIQRKLGRKVAAEANYKSLLNTPYAGYAQHGLGLIYAGQDLALGSKYLQRAVDLRPTDARMRNDLGYAQMRQHKLTQARLNLATAYQLDSGFELARNNYIVVLLLDGDERSARQVAGESRITRDELGRLRAQAAALDAGDTQRADASAATTTAGGFSRRSVDIGSGGG